MTNVEVALERGATDDERAAVEEAFRRVGFDVRATDTVEYRSSGPVPWIVMVTLATPIAAFFHAFAAEAGKDAYAAVKQWVRDLWDARATAGEGAVRLHDAQRSTLVLSTRIPDEALDALSRVDWEAVSGDYLTWDEARGEWGDAMKT